MPRPSIILFADILAGLGGIETYLDALARTLHAEGWPVRIAVSLNGPTSVLDELEALGIPVYRQPGVPGDRFFVRQRLLVRSVARSLAPGDWVFCVRQPMPQVYLPLVRAVHARGAKVAASWMFAPEFLPPPPGRIGAAFRRAIVETDTVISVSRCTVDQYRTVYGYEGPVSVVHYHNLPLFDAPVPLPPAPPYAIGFIGRIDIEQKNLDTILDAVALLVARRRDIVVNLHGGGADLDRLRAMIVEKGLSGTVRAHGRYDHRTDLPGIMAANHIFLYTSRYEGGPCFSLLELLQAGRYVVTSPVGGIPDIYDGHEEAGLMVPPDDPEAIAEGLAAAIGRLARGNVDVEAIRQRYVRSFSAERAHAQWLRALSLNGSLPRDNEELTLDQLGPPA